MTLTVGEILQNRYRIVSPLGQGGMGAVYQAWHLSLNLPIAIKEMMPQPDLDAQVLAQLRQQFQHEAATLARLDHPHLVAVIDFFEEGDNAYLVMHLVEGESLADRIERDSALSEDQVLVWADQLLDALEYCHNQGVIHRDIKPQNVIIRSDERAILVDFGLVKLWDPSDPRTKTVVRGLGTPEYAPPEQYSVHRSHTDPRSDLYSLGATLYHALVGYAPMTATDRMATPDQFEPVRDLNPRVSAGTETAILKAMELPLVNRFKNAAEMKTSLGIGVPTPTLFTKQSTKVMPSARVTTSPRSRRVPVWVWITSGIIAFVLLIYLVKFGFGWKSADELIATLFPTVTSTVVPTSTRTFTPTPTATPTRAPTLGDTRTRPTDGMVMVYVPSGTFQMGSIDAEIDAAFSLCEQDLGSGECEQNWYIDESPQHLVTLDAFWIDRAEVSNIQYRQCVEAGECDAPTTCDWGDLTFSDAAKDDHPVVCVNWHEADAYCQWAGAQLPTEAQWEYAAKGTQGYVYPWGNTFDGARVNFCDANCTYDWKTNEYDDGYERTSPVASFPNGSSWCDAMNMAGNVWEWTTDWYGDYFSGAQINPTGPTERDRKVLRGGGWVVRQTDVRASYRGSHPTEFRSPSLGLRCVDDVLGQ
ncbi:MAG: SUMF1/EgtB/PvdO family nonheme iron enzyme [Chloroflexi bacterium]|nr:SUMF1/EgtB/PvdO family nonheme iron enzyme [Chloroflexota bacterium]